MLLEDCYDTVDRNLDGNEISTVEGLEFLSNLEELAISNQKIEGPLVFDAKCMVGISNSLRVLSCENDQITNLENIWFLAGLETLKVARNQILRLDELEKPLACLGALKELDLSQNPVNYIPKIRDHIVLMSGPTLQSLNNKSILKNEREFLINWAKRKYFLSLCCM